MQSLGITKEQAKALLAKWITDPVTRLHSLESAAIMATVARRLGEDEASWWIIGLLHDIDWDETKENTAEHCVRCREILQEAGGSDFLIETIVSHGYGNEDIPSLADKAREGPLQHALVASETLTGIITAAALVQPDRKLASVKLKSLKKKFKDKSFAARCDRSLVAECEEIPIPRDEFLELGLTALQNISDELGM